jgi:lysophospholipase L1-like esterase
VTLRRLLLAVLALALLATGCDYTGTTGPRVALTGDSVMDNAKLHVRHWLVRDHRITMLTAPAAHVHDLRGIVALQARSRPDAMVVQVGSPDVELAAESPYGFTVSLDIKRTMDATKGVPCVIWVNIKEQGVSPYYTPQWRQQATALNDYVDALLRERPWVRVLDWASTSIGHPDWFLADGLHLTERGRTALARAIDTAVRGC